MGMFDTLYYECPKCGAHNEEQTKSAAQPLLRSFHLDDLPLDAVAGLGVMYCGVCATRLAVEPRQRVEFRVVVLDGE